MPAEVPSPPEPLIGAYPHARLKLHWRLNKEVELYRLHGKLYHVSVSDFRKRTSEVALPDPDEIVGNMNML